MMKEVNEKPNSVVVLWEQIKRYFALRLDYTKLTVTDALITILGALVVGFVCLFMGIVVLFFLLMAAVYFLTPLIGEGCAYILVAGVALLLIAIVLLLRRSLILDPLARFISRIILKK